MLKMKDGRQLDHNTLEKMRIRALQSRLDGHSISGIARVLGLNRGSVSRWMTTFKRYGKTSLLSRKAAGPSPKLNCDMYGPKILEIVSHEATNYKFENPLWTCARIRRVIKSELNIKVSTSTVWRGLKKLSLSAQKPERRAVEQDPEKRARWLSSVWPKIKKRAKEEKAIVFFQDEACIRLTPTVGTSWGVVGTRPKITVTGKRASLCVMSAVSASGNLFFSIPDQNVDGLCGRRNFFQPK